MYSIGISFTWQVKSTKNKLKYSLNQFSLSRHFFLQCTVLVDEILEVYVTSQTGYGVILRIQEKLSCTTTYKNISTQAENKAQLIIRNIFM